MKSFKTGCLILGLMISALGFTADELQPSSETIEIAKQIESHQQLILDNQNSPSVLLQISNQLNHKSLRINDCIQKNQKELDRVTAEHKLIKDPVMNNYLTDKKNQGAYWLQHYQEELDLCKLLNYKISMMNKQIENFNQINYLNSYSLKRDDFLKSFHDLDFSKIQLLPKGYVIKTFLAQSNAARYTKWLTIIFLLILILKIIQSFEWVSKKYLEQLSIQKYVLIAIIFIFLSPVQYLILKTGYSHHQDILINLYKKPSNFIMTMAVLYYLYHYLDKRFLKHYLMMLILSFMSEICLISLCFALYYFELNSVYGAETLFFRYLILMNLQFVLFYLFYWLFLGVFSISQKILRYFIIFFFPIFIIFLAGLYGFVDMAIHVDFSIIFLSINLVWLIITYKVKNIVVSYAMHPTPKFKESFKKIFGINESKAMTNLRLLIEFIFFSISFQVIAISIVSVIWLFSQDMIYQIYEFFYGTQLLGNFNFVIINYMYAIVTFLILNIFNYAFANFCAHKIFDEPVARQKMAQFIYIMGLILISLISLAITKINLQNLMLLFGGLSIGIGLGLKNILSNLISSIILFTNRPFELGDLVSISTTKGFIRKVGILETMIETLDHDIVILPNQMIASSAIENFTYGQKNLHQIHLKYRVVDLTEQQEEVIQEVVLKIFQESEFIIINEIHEPQFIFSPDTQNPDGFEIEIIFNINTLHHLKNIISELNREILASLDKKGIEIKFNTLTHPLM